MRRIWLTMALITGLAVISNAQTNTGDWMLGGNFRINTSDNNTQIGLTPMAGYFVIPNLAVGGSFNLSYSKSGNNKYTTFGVGPFARYYFTTESQTVRPIVHGSFSYLSTKNKVGSTTSSTNTGTNYFVGGGAAFFISPSVSLDAVMGYDHTHYKNSTSGGFAFNLGFQVYINKGLMEKMTGGKNK